MDHKSTLSFFLIPAFLTFQVSADLFPNGDFSDGQGSWLPVSGGGTFSFDYPTTGGNDGGYGVIDHTAADGGFGIWVGNNGDSITLSSLGLEAGQTYRFSQDMKILAGNNIGGFKLDFFLGAEPAGSSGDLRTEAIGDGSTWETYQFRIPLPVGIDGIKVVPLWGTNSSVGYDNFSFDPTPIPSPLIPNGDFESGNSSWLQVGEDTTWTYNTDGGNPDRHGTINNTGPGEGTWTANNGAPIPLASLGLSAGDLVDFKMDLILKSGTAMGGLRVDFLQGADFLSATENLFPVTGPDSGTWQTYTFPVEIPANTDHIKIILLGGATSEVGFDNVTFDVEPAPPAVGSAPRLVTGTYLTWTPPNDTRVYQPQRSTDNENWTDFGGLATGNSARSAFDVSNAPFYRVVATDPPGTDVVYNGDFTFDGFTTENSADGWQSLPPSGQFPTRITSDFRSAPASMRLAVQNDASGAPNNSEIQQNVNSFGGFLNAGETYRFSFWAKQISSGVSYVQRFRIQFLDFDANILPGAPDFQDFTGGAGTWREVVLPALVIPENTATALIQIFGATGAVPGVDAKGEVLIDDVSFLPLGAGEPAILETTTQPGIGIEWVTEPGVTYQGQGSEDLDGFFNLGAPILGNGNRAAIGISQGEDQFFFRYVRP